MTETEAQVRTPTFCALCVSRCGATAVTVDGRFTALEPDPAHPTGRALCVKGKAAPAIVGHAERVLHPLRRTAPKGADDPAWERISWEEVRGAGPGGVHARPRAGWLHPLLGV